MNNPKNCSTKWWAPKVRIPVCPKMHALAKMANIHQNRSKNSNEMAKVRFESGYFDENGDFDKNGELSPKFDECSYDVAKGPF